MRFRKLALLSVIGLGAATITAVAATPGGVAAGGRHSVDIQPIVQEYDIDGTAIEDPPRVGRALLIRSDRGLKGAARITGLVPGGVYTFWWVVVQGDGAFPDDIFVARGGGKIARPNGTASTFMRARTGQDGIDGFMPDGVNEIEFASLSDPHALTRIEVAYHGQADDAGGDLDEWLSDFWTGSACPPDTPNPNPEQPHCPVYYAATFDG